MARLRCCVAVGDRQRLFLQNHCLIQLQMLPIGSGSLHLRLILLASDILARQAVVRIFFSPAFFLFSYALPGRRPTRQLHTTFRPMAKLGFDNFAMGLLYAVLPLLLLFSGRLLLQISFVRTTNEICITTKMPFVLYFDYFASTLQTNIFNSTL
jgi:hypothetical protein